MALHAVDSDADVVELYPTAALRGAKVKLFILFALRVNPDEGFRTDTELFQNVQLLHRGHAADGVRAYGQSGAQVSEGGGGDEFGVDLRERATVDAYFDEARLDLRAVNAALELARPAAGQLRGALFISVRRNEGVLTRAVIAGVGDDVQAGGGGEPVENRNVSPQPGRSAIDERAAAQLRRALHARQRRCEDLLRFVTITADLIGADEIDHHVLVHQRDAQPLGVDFAPHGHHRKLRLGGRVAGQRRAGQRGHCHCKKSPARYFQIRFRRVTHDSLPSRGLSFRGSGGRRLASDHDDRAVVLVQVVAGLRAIEDAVAERGDFGAAELLGQRFDLADAFIAVVGDFGENAVGIDHQLIADRKRRDRFRECAAGLRADSATGHWQLFMARDLRALWFAHLDHRQMSRVDVPHLFPFPSGHHAGESPAPLKSLPQIAVQLFQNIRQVGFAVDDLSQALTQVGDLAEGVEAFSV